MWSLSHKKHIQLTQTQRLNETCWSSIELCLPSTNVAIVRRKTCCNGVIFDQQTGRTTHGWYLFALRALAPLPVKVGSRLYTDDELWHSNNVSSFSDKCHHVKWPTMQSRWAGQFPSLSSCRFSSHSFELIHLVSVREWLHRLEIPLNTVYF